MLPPNAADIFGTISTFTSTLSTYKPNVTELDQLIRNLLIELSDLFNDAVAYTSEPTVLQYQALTTQMDRIHIDVVDLSRINRELIWMLHLTKYLQLELINNLREEV